MPQKILQNKNPKLKSCTQNLPIQVVHMGLEHLIVSIACLLLPFHEAQPLGSVPIIEEQHAQRDLAIPASSARLLIVTLQ